MIPEIKMVGIKHRGDAGHYRCTVDESQTLFWGQGEGGQTQTRQSRPRLDDVTIVLDEITVQSGDASTDIGKRDEVPACPDRPELMDPWGVAGIQEGNESLDELEANSGATVKMRIHPAKHRRAHVVRGQQGTHAHFKRTEQRHLQGGGLLGGDHDPGHAAEPCRHSVDGLAVPHGAFDEGA